MNVLLQLVPVLAVGLGLAGVFYNARRVVSQACGAKR
jgi:hypothetical protein